MDNDNGAAPRLREPALVFTRPDHAPSPRRDFTAAMELVDKASHVIDALQARVRQLELETREVRERSRLEVEAAESLAAEWQRLARATKTQLEDCEKRLATMKQNSDAAEARAEQLKEKLNSLQHLAAEEADQSARFHDKIVSAFGTGTRTQNALDTLGL